MSEVRYYPSPFRRDYTRNPTIPQPIPQVKESQIQSEVHSKKNQYHLNYFRNGLRFTDGLLIAETKNSKAGIFLMNWFTGSNYDDIGFLIYSVEQNQLNQSKIKGKKAENKRVNWIPHGRQYMIYNNGIKLSAEYKHGVIDRWLIGLRKDKFVICHHYKNGNKDGQQYYYDYSQRILVVSQYKTNNLIFIREGVIGQFQKLVDDHNLIKQIQNLRDYTLKHPQIKPTRVNEFYYFGRTIREEGIDIPIPHGLGVLFNDHEAFMGKFNEGCLHHVGLIKFPKKNLRYYLGQIDNGVFAGYGRLLSRGCVKYMFKNEEIDQSEFHQFIKEMQTVQIHQQFVSIFKQMMSLYSFIKLQKLCEANLQQEQEQSLSDSLADQSNRSHQSNQSYHFQHIQRENEGSEIEINISSDPIVSSTRKSFLQTPRKPEFPKSKPQNTAVPTTTQQEKIISFDSREDIRYIQIHQREDRINQQRKYQKPQNFETQPTFSKHHPGLFHDANRFQNTHRFQDMSRRNQMRINIGQIQQQDSESDSCKLQQMIRHL